MQAARVIVTRPARDARHWVRQLRQAGIDAEALPLIDIAPLAHTLSPQALSGYAAALFVSGHAVDHFFQGNTAFSHYPRGRSAINTVAEQELGPVSPELRFMAPGPGTVAALRAASVPAALIDAPPADASQFDSEALWRVVGELDWRGRRALIVRGRSAGAEGDSPGRDWIARQWRDAGASVDFALVYQRRAPPLDEAQLRRARAASADGSIWLFSSSEAVANLVGHAALRRLDWSSARALVTHPRIGQAARAAGWGVVAASRPALDDIRQALGSMEAR